MQDLTEAELEELEMCDQWVQLMADLDQLEQVTRHVPSRVSLCCAFALLSARC